MEWVWLWEVKVGMYKVEVGEVEAVGSGSMWG